MYRRMTYLYLCATTDSICYPLFSPLNHRLIVVYVCVLCKLVVLAFHAMISSTINHHLMSSKLALKVGEQLSLLIVIIVSHQAYVKTRRPAQTEDRQHFIKSSLVPFPAFHSSKEANTQVIIQHLCICIFDITHS